MFDHCGCRTKTGNISINSNKKGEHLIFEGTSLICQIHTAEASYEHQKYDHGFLSPIKYTETALKRVPSVATRRGEQLLTI